MSIRLDTVQAMEEGSPEPIGTLKEVRELGLRPIKYGSCSAPSKNNIGCKHFESEIYGPCPILQLCRAKGRPGYENVAFLRMLTPRVQKQDAMKCFQYMETLAHSDPRGGVNHILGLGGDVIIKRRGSEPIDPNNPRSLMRMTLKPERVPRVPRPKEAMAEVVAGLELARDMQARALGQDVSLLNSAGEARAAAGADDTHESDDELLADADRSMSGEDDFGVDDLDDDVQRTLDAAGDNLLDDESGDDEQGEGEPEAVRQVAGNGRRRERRARPRAEVSESAFGDKDVLAD